MFHFSKTFENVSSESYQKCKTWKSNPKQKSENGNWKRKLEIVGGSRNLKVLAENETQQKLKMFALKSF